MPPQTSVVSRQWLRKSRQSAFTEGPKGADSARAKAPMSSAVPFAKKMLSQLPKERVREKMREKDESSCQKKCVNTLHSSYVVSWGTNANTICIQGKCFKDALVPRRFKSADSPIHFYFRLPTCSARACATAQVPTSDRLLCCKLRSSRTEAWQWESTKTSW